MYGQQCSQRRSRRVDTVVTDDEHFDVRASAGNPISATAEMMPKPGRCRAASSMTSPSGKASSAILDGSGTAATGMMSMEVWSAAALAASHVQT